MSKPEEICCSKDDLRGAVTVVAVPEAEADVDGLNCGDLTGVFAEEEDAGWGGGKTYC